MVLLVLSVRPEGTRFLRSASEKRNTKNDRVPLCRRLNAGRVRAGDNIAHAVALSACASASHPSPTMYERHFRRYLGRREHHSARPRLSGSAVAECAPGSRMKLRAAFGGRQDQRLRVEGRIGELACGSDNLGAIAAIKAGKAPCSNAMHAGFKHKRAGDNILGRVQLGLIGRQSPARRESGRADDPGNPAYAKQDPRNARRRPALE